MQEIATTRRIHPLLAAAAVSVIVFSAVGIAAVTGVLPHSIGSSKESTPPALATSPAPAPVAASQPAAVEPAADPVDASAMPPAAPRSTPVKPAHKKVVKAKPPVQVAEAAPVAQAAAVPPPPPAVEAPKPIPGLLGVVDSVREVKETPKTNGAGPILGGLAGAVAGHQVGQGKGNVLATVVGAAGGAFGGLAVEGKVREVKHWEVVVRLDDGTTQTLRSDTAPYWHGGERVRLVDGRLTPA
jgi:outer membrane lipoprotein SlyB